MTGYERNTVYSAREVFERAHQMLTTDVEMERTKESRHAVTYTGGEGTVMIDAHRHGPYTTVTARTDQVRTSRLDEVIRHFLNSLPYQPEDPPKVY